MSESIAIVVVTYNRLELFKKCIDGVRRQTLKPDAIIVINNDSTDGTGEWLASQTDLIVYNQPNLGGAGGFQRGIKEAYEGDFDWIWVMDDDVEPIENGLELLMNYKHVSKCIHGLKITSGGELQIIERFMDFKTAFCYGSDSLSDLARKDYFFINVACFEGMLIHRSIVEKIGYPNPDFFINGDDTLYGFLASRYTNVISITKPVLIKDYFPPIIKSRFGPWVTPSPTSYYYYFRNKFIIRNELRTRLNEPVADFAREYGFHSFKFIFKCLLAGKFAYAQNVILGTYHGMTSRFGKK